MGRNKKPFEFFLLFFNQTMISVMNWLWCCSAFFRHGIHIPLFYSNTFHGSVSGFFTMEEKTPSMFLHSYTKTTGSPRRLPFSSRESLQLVCSLDIP